MAERQVFIIYCDLKNSPCKLFSFFYFDYMKKADVYVDVVLWKSRCSMKDDRIDNGNDNCDLKNSTCKLFFPILVL